MTLGNFANTVSVYSIETVAGGTGDDIVFIKSLVTNASFTLGAGIDTLNLFDGGSTVSVGNVETINGNIGDDVVILTSAASMTINLDDGDDKLMIFN